MEFEQYFATAMGYFGSESWVVQVFLIVFISLFINLMQKRLLRKLHKNLSRTKNYWDDSLIEAAQRPLSALIWVLGLSFAAEIVQRQSDAVVFDAVEPIREVGVIVSLVWFLVRLYSSG